jgi:hypothetical protein
VEPDGYLEIAVEAVHVGSIDEQKLVTVRLDPLEPFRRHDGCAAPHADCTFALTPEQAGLLRDLLDQKLKSPC